MKTSPTGKAFFSLRGSPQESDWSEFSDEEYGFDDIPSVRLPVQGPSIKRDDKQRLREELALNQDCSRTTRYHGKSSPANLVRATREQRREAFGSDGFYDLSKDSDAPLNDVSRTGITDVPRSRRSIYWNLLPVNLILIQYGIMVDYIYLPNSQLI